MYTALHTPAKYSLTFYFFLVLFCLHLTTHTLVITFTAIVSTVPCVYVDKLKSCAADIHEHFFCLSIVNTSHSIRLA